MTTSPTTDIQPELLPCPFCNGPAVNVAGEYATCGAPAFIDCAGRTIRADFEAWNTRLTSTTPTLGDMVMVPREMTDEMASALACELMRQSSHLGWEPTAMWSAALSAAPASPIPTSVANEGERERIACIIDADAMRPLEHYQAEWEKHFEVVLSIASASDKVDVPAVRARLAQEEYDGMARRRVEALSKADAILALSPALDNTAVEGARTILVRRDYRVPDSDHVPYQAVLHSHEDKSRDRFGLFANRLRDGIRTDGLLSEAGVEDGDEFELIVRKTGARPFGDRRYLLVADGTYRPETDAEMAFRAEHGRYWNYRSDATLTAETEKAQ